MHTKGGITTNIDRVVEPFEGKTNTSLTNNGEEEPINTKAMAGFYDPAKMKQIESKDVTGMFNKTEQKLEPEALLTKQETMRKMASFRKAVEKPEVRARLNIV